jgi:hypothetical protein
VGYNPQGINKNNFLSKQGDEVYKNEDVSAYKHMERNFTFFFYYSFKAHRNNIYIIKNLFE